MSWTSPAEMRGLLIRDRQTHSLCDVSRIDSYSSRVPGRIAIPGVKCRHECGGERQVRAFELPVRRRETFSKVALSL